MNQLVFHPWEFDLADARGINVDCDVALKNELDLVDE